MKVIINNQLSKLEHWKQTRVVILNKMETQFPTESQTSHQTELLNKQATLTRMKITIRTWILK